VNKTVRVMLAAAMLLSSRVAFADDWNKFEDGNRLLMQCASAVAYLDSGENGVLTNPFDAGVCLGTMNGLLGLHQIYTQALGKQTLFCLPDGGLTVGQAVRIVVKHLREHPEKLDLRATTLAAGALRLAFPCE